MNQILLPSNCVGDKMNHIYDTVDGQLQFTKAYLKKRQWKAAATVPSFLRFSITLRNELYRGTESDHELIECARAMGTTNADDALSMWLSTHCEGRWDKIGNQAIEFELESDAFYYKLMWMEDLNG